MNDLTGTADNIKSLQLTAQTYSGGGKAQSRGESRTTGALAVTAVANVSTNWIASDGIADLPTKAAAGHCGHRLSRLVVRTRREWSASTSTGTRVTADLFRVVKWYRCFPPLPLAIVDVIMGKIEREGRRHMTSFNASGPNAERGLLRSGFSPIYCAIGKVHTATFHQST